jgi:hypothetical protein
VTAWAGTGRSARGGAHVGPDSLHPEQSCAHSALPDGGSRSPGALVRSRVGPLVGARRRSLRSARRRSTPASPAASAGGTDPSRRSHRGGQRGQQLGIIFTGPRVVLLM